MNLGTGAEAALFPEKEYICGISVAMQNCKEILYSRGLIEKNGSSDSIQILRESTLRGQSPNTKFDQHSFLDRELKLYCTCHPPKKIVHYKGFLYLVD
jgi:hypothetical protein